MVLKIIAMGFFMRAHSYLRDSWNILDFTVVLLGWISNLFGGEDISAIKVIRILRPLRTINQIPNMSSLVSTILNSLPIMFDVMVLFLFMLIMFGTIATQLLGGRLEKRCSIYRPSLETGEIEQIVTLGEDQVEIICQSDAMCLELQPEGVTGSTCDVYGNPIQGTYSFDNILLSIMNIFQIITLEGWTDMMYIVRDAEQSYGYDIFFVSCVIFGSFVILNLMIAVQATYLDRAFDEEDNRQKELQEKIDLKKRLKIQLDEDEEEEYGEEEGEPSEEPEESPQHEEEVDADGRRKSSKRRKKEKSNGCCFCLKKPDCFVKISNKLDAFTASNQFERVIIVLILINTAFLAVEHYEQPAWLDKVCEIANLFFTIIFAVEMILKLVGQGCKKYMS